MIDFAAARKKMVENQLRTSSITDYRLLAVFAQVPREQFVPAPSGVNSHISMSRCRCRPPRAAFSRRRRRSPGWCNWRE